MGRAEASAMTIYTNLILDGKTEENIHKLQTSLCLSADEIVQRLVDDGLSESSKSTEILNELVKLRNRYVHEFDEAIKSMDAKTAHNLLQKVYALYEAVDTAVEVMVDV